MSLFSNMKIYLSLTFIKVTARIFKQTNNDQVHIALTLGDWKSSETILTRINSSMNDNNVTKILKGTNEIKYDEIFKKTTNYFF